MMTKTDSLAISEPRQVAQPFLLNPGRYVFASYIDEPVVRKTTGSSGTVLYFQSNQQYSILALTDSSGNVSERYAYTYTAREWDATLGLQYFRARWMSGLTGRFLTRDPIGYAGGISLNQFVSGMVFSVTDPLGLEPTMKVVTPATALSDCGAATFKVKFEMSLLDRGWILQHVKVEAWVTDCEDNPVEAINSDSELTEGWEVANGKVYIGLMADEFKHAGDTYETVDEGNQRKGTIQITGNVKFIANYKLTIPPWNAGGSGPAGGLPTIEPTPPGWVDDGQDHSMTVTFDCCCHGSKPSVSSTPR